MIRRNKVNDHHGAALGLNRTGARTLQRVTRSRPQKAFSLRLVIFAVIIFVVVVIFVAKRWYYVPAALGIHASSAAFSGERAFEHMLQLSCPAAVGSRRVENNAAFIEETIVQALRCGGHAQCERRLDLKERRESLGLEVTLERQFGNGSFEMDFSQLGAQMITNMYTNVSNIILRFDPRTGNVSQRASHCPSAIVLNSHYDTAPGSPGASDALTPIGVMLELARLVIYTSAQHYAKHGTSWLHAPLIFLFNGAEEAVLLGSHAFVTHHPAVNETAMLVNLESAGAGTGPEILFRYDSRAPWLMNLYADTVPHPHTGCYVQDVFERNLIPAETDFRMFTETAGVAGMDLAFHLHSYTYHTRYDTPSRVDVRSVQHMGENVWALLQVALRERASILCATASRLGLPESSRLSDRIEPLVFFDILSRKVIHFRHRAASRVYAVGALLLAWLAWQPKRFLHASSFRAKRPTSAALAEAQQPMLSLFRAISAVILGTVAGFLAPLTIAFVLTNLLPGPRPPMVWYGRHLLVLPCLYGAPALASALTTADRILNRKQNQGSNETVAMRVLRFEQMERAVAMCFMALVLVLGLHMQLTMAYIWALQVGLHMLNSMLFRLLRPDWWPAFVVFLRFCIFVIVPQLFHVPPVLMTLETFGPLMGMAGARAKVEFLMATVTAYLTMLWLFMLWLPLLCLHRAWIRGASRAMFAAFLLGGVIHLVPHWFNRVPYTVNAPKRLVLQHVCIQQPISFVNTTTEQARAQAITMADRTCLVGVAGLDPYPLERVLPQTRYPQCEANRLTWGYRGQRSLFANVAPLDALVRDAGRQCFTESSSTERPWSLPMPYLVIREDTRMECPTADQAERSSNHTERMCRALTFEIHAPRAHWSAMIFDATIRQWSLTSGAPNEGRHRRHFVRHVAGHGTVHKWNMSMVLELDPNQVPLTIDLTATRFGENQSELHPVFWSKSFPDWTTTTYMTSAFASYVI
jgi:hypothetical protein